MAKSKKMVLTYTPEVTPAPTSEDETPSGIRVNWKAKDAELECLNERISQRDATIASQAEQIERLREALIAIMPYTATQCVGCHGDKCRESWCYSCNGEEEANEAVKAGQEAYNLARAALQPKEGEG